MGSIREVIPCVHICVLKRLGLSGNKLDSYFFSMNYTIYKLTNITNGLCYIGCTTQYLQRLRQYKSPNRKDYNSAISTAIRDTGWENFNKEVLCICTNIEVAYLLEDWFISHFDSINNGYNLKTGGLHPVHSIKSQVKINLLGQKGSLNRAAKPVLQFSRTGKFLNRWGSITEAAKALQLHQTNISKCCIGKAKFTGGYSWRFE